jgi:hypothetical protein
LAAASPAGLAAAAAGAAAPAAGAGFGWLWLGQWHIFYIKVKCRFILAQSQFLQIIDKSFTRLYSDSSKSFVLIMQSVGQTSVQSPQNIQRPWSILKSISSNLPVSALF